MKGSFLSRWLRLWAAGLVLTLTTMVFGAEPAQPQIAALRTNRTSLLVTVKVPKGWQAVRLESRADATAGAWVPRAIIRSGLGSGKVVFKLPKSLQGQRLQAQGVLQEPLAKSFYKGKHTFARRKSSFWQPDQGRGEVLSVPASGSATAMAGMPIAAATTRTVVESDIWKVSGDTLYFFNQLRGLQIIDISQPDAPVIRGTLSMPAVGEDMFLLDAQHVVLLTRDGCSDGWQSHVVVVDVSGPTPLQVTSLPVQGWVEESRLVGSVLYVAGEGFDPASGTNIDSAPWGTVVSSIDLANPAAPKTRSTLWFPGTGNAVLATDRFLFVAVSDWNGDSAPVPEVRVIDISAANGTMRDVGGVRTAGEVQDKFKMNLNGDVFSVISQQYLQAPYGWSQSASTLETFSLANPAAPAALGSLQLAQGEELHATRYDGNRAYIVTAQGYDVFQIEDPLWVVDLSDPAHPAITGSVESPGWVSYIAPLGDQLVMLGSVSNRVAVSLFNVHDPANPALVSRVPLGSDYSWSSATYDEKALTILADIGLILVPYAGNTADGWANRVQLLDLGVNSLTARGFIEQGCSPRRTTAHDGRLLSVSNQDLLSINAADRDHPVVTQDTPLAWRADRVFLVGNYLLEIDNGNTWRASAAPAVRVASGAEPDQVLNTLNLTNLHVVGISLHSNLLYVLQSPYSWFGVALPSYSPFPGGSQNSGTLLMTIVDVGALPVLQVRSQLTITATGALTGSYDAVWPTPDLLVWFNTGFGYWINPLLDSRPIGVLPLRPGIVATPGHLLGPGTPTYPAVSAYPAPATGLAPRAPVSGSSPAVLSGTPFYALPYWWPWWNYDGVRLLAVNVADPASPQLVSQFNFKPDNGWGFSKAFAAQGLIYFTHEQSTNLSTVQPVSISQPGDSSWRVNDVLDVVDFADPTTPTLRPPVIVPGQLTGLSDDGSILYLLGNAGAKAGAAIDSREAVNACSYDGVAAYVLDSLALPQNWPRPVRISHGQVYLACPTDESGTASTLQTWSLSAKGKFTLQAKLQVPQPIWALGVFGNLLAAQTGNSGVSLFDVSSSDALRLVGQGGPSGCLWFDFNNADGALSTGLYLPLDDYGVAFVPVSF